MKSKLFQKLADLPGINIFNWKEKVTLATNTLPRIEPKEDDSEGRLARMAEKYFKRLVAQDAYIKTIHKIIYDMDFETQKWDIIQSNHEQEIADIRKECIDKIQNVRLDCEAQLTKANIGLLKQKIDQLESQLKKKDRKIEALEKAKGPIISDAKAERLLVHIARVESSLTGNRKSDAGRLREITTILRGIVKRDNTIVLQD